MASPTLEETANSEYLAITEVAKLTNMSEAFWWKQIRLKNIPYAKLGSSVRVRRSALGAWLQAREVAE
jgi:excisionase family DNA binding protein